MMLRFVVIAGLVLGGFVGVATACPPGPCNKYRHMMPPPVVTPTTYTRTLPGAPPVGGYDRIARFLAASTWAPILAPMPPGAVQPLPLRFISPTNARRPVQALVRSVLIRRIERHDSMTLVEVDGAVFELSRCGTRQRPMACLTRSDATLDDPELETEIQVSPSDGNFAQPPP